MTSTPCSNRSYSKAWCADLKPSDGKADYQGRAIPARPSRLNPKSSMKFGLMTREQNYLQLALFVL